MRKRGTGSVSEIDDGRFRVRVYAAGERKSCGVYATREDAETILNAIIASAKGAGASSTKGITLAAWGGIVLERRELSGLRSVQSEHQRWACYVMKADFAQWPIRSIARADVKRWLRRLTVATQTKRNAVNLLRAVFREAVEDELVDANPVADLSVKSQGRTEEVSTFLTLAELDALLWSVDESERPMVAVAAGTGVRQGELRSLKLCDVHVDGESPHFIARYGKPGLPRKNGHILRVPLFGLALYAMRAHLAAMRGDNPKGLAFPTVRGCVRPLGRIVMPDDWATWLRRAGIRRTVRWHDLRHTCGTLLLQGAWGRAWTLEEVKELLGHSSVRVTERYARATGSLSERAAKDERSRSGHDEPRNSMQTWGPRTQNDSSRRGRDSNPCMTVLQGLDKRKRSATLDDFLASSRALESAAARYGAAMASQSPHVHRFGAELMGAAFDAAAMMQAVAAPQARASQA